MDSLSQYYNDLKSQEISPSQPLGGPDLNMIKFHKPDHHRIIADPSVLRWKKATATCRDQLVDGCRKHFLLDLYINILPLDNDYKDGHMGQMKGDINNMLAKKGMTATQYLTSAYNNTKAPMIEFVLRSTDNIGKKFVEDTDKVMKDAQENELSVPAPQAPSTDDKEVSNQLVDIKDDPEVTSFYDELKAKTEKKLVDDISKIINSKKEDNSMKFSPNSGSEVTESAVAIGLNFLNAKCMKESVEVNNELQEEMLGMSIREATLHEIDLVFNQNGSDIKSFESAIRYNKGSVINEAAYKELIGNNNFFHESGTMKDDSAEIIKYVKPLKDQNSIDNFAKENKIKFPKEFIEFFKKYNGGRPVNNEITLKNKCKKVVNTFLSFNTSDKENIYKAYKNISNKKLIPFANDSAGNLYCLSNDKVVFYFHEDDSITEVESSFKKFISKLGIKL